MRSDNSTNQLSNDDSAKSPNANPSTLEVANPSQVQEPLVVPFDLFVAGSRFQRDETSNFDSFEVNVELLHSHVVMKRFKTRKVDLQILDVNQAWVDVSFHWGIHYEIKVLVPPEEAENKIDLGFDMKIAFMDSGKCW